MNKLWKASLFLLATAGTLLILTHHAGAGPSPLPMPSPIAVASPMPTQIMTAVPEVAAPPEWLTMILVQMQGLPYVGPPIVFIVKWAGVLAVFLTSLAIFFLSLARGLDKVSELSPYLQWMSKAADSINRITPWLKWASMLNQPQPWKPDAGGPESKS
jgi:Trk-type K+ transport system membrane component